MNPWLVIVLAWTLGGNPADNERLFVPIPFPSKQACEQFLNSDEFKTALEDFKAKRLAIETPVEAKAQCEEM
jgi:hypothetical protein